MKLDEFKKLVQAQREQERKANAQKTAQIAKSVNGGK
jgi:hypothetical protein